MVQSQRNSEYGSYHGLERTPVDAAAIIQRSYAARRERELMLSRESLIVIAEEDVLSSVVEGEVVLLGLRKGHYYTLDAVGADIWRMIAEPTAVNAIIARIGQEYDAPTNLIEADVLRLLRDLAQEGLIKIAGGAATKRKSR